LGLIEGRRPLTPVSRLLGWKLLNLDAAAGTSRVEFAALPDFLNPIGTVQGGIVSAMLDDAMGLAACAFLGGYHITPTVDLRTNFMRPATVGPLFVEARVAHGGRSILFVEGAMRDQDGKLLATATATARRYPWPTASLEK